MSGVLRDVVLVPGLWMPAAAMWPMAARLARGGYATRAFGYPGRGPFEANVERFARFARASLAGRPAHFIGHSLGGVLVLETLSRHRDIALGTALLLGAPARGSMAGRSLARYGIGRWMMGASQPLWAERDACWERPEPLGIVAGTKPRGLATVAGVLPGESDGVVRVEETAVEGMAARTLVPEAHSMLIVSARVAKLAERFLAAERFE